MPHLPFSLQPSAFNLARSAKVLLFDFDGTIADTRTLALRILNELSEEFRFRSLPEEELPEARNMTTQKLIRHLGIRRWRVPKIARRGLVKFQERIHEVEPIAEMPAILDQLHERGFRLGILTSNSQTNVTAFLKHHHISCFEFIRSSSKLFGKARELRRIMKEHHLQTEELIYIGDETRDIEATHSTAIRMAAVTWGYNSADILRSMNPEFLFDKPEQLLTFQCCTASQ
ncbi:MAG: HAD family hydrolase [Verrucomicrobia bacterium]|nr:HAD family hydrolase [Verrucomicrobiota bacterium]